MSSPIERRVSGGERQGWVQLATAVTDRVLAGAVQDMHRAISDRAFRRLGPVGRPVQRIHDRFTFGVYGIVRASIRGAGDLGGRAAGGAGPRPDAVSGAGLRARAIAHGVFGDELIALAPGLDMELTIRHGGREVTPDAAGLSHGFPDASGRVTVFVHGLVDSEQVWEAPPGVETSLLRTARAQGTTPVLVRYGSGRAIARNGAALAATLEALVDGWPVPVTQLALVGHSMGGLVIRSACAAAVTHEHRWIDPLTDIVYLATPHLGSWLEKAANIGSWGLRRHPTSAPIGRLLDARSSGIKDLRHGTITPDAWGGTPVDDLLTGLAVDTPWLADVVHHVVVGRLDAHSRHPVNVTFGDALVRAGSAAGAGRRRRIGAGGDVVVVDVAASHTRLARHPEVSVLLTQILTR